MSHPRVSLALAAPDALPAEGRIAVWRATRDTDLSDLPRERVQVIQGFAPDFDALKARGFDVVAEPGAEYTGAIVFLPRAKAEARAILFEANARIAAGGPVWVDGAKHDGVDSVLKDLRTWAVVTPPLAKAHGKIFAFAAGAAAPAEWQARPGEPAPGFVTAPGVFSADGIDRGSALLAEALPAKLPARMADLGAGWGWLAAQVLAREGVESIDLIEAEHAALDCARRNVTDPRARFIWADATAYVPEARYSGIVMNPPFHTSRAADPALGAAFIRAAASMLSLSGTLWMVANRHLPYEEALRASFHEIEELAGDGGFKIIRAAKPIVGGSKPVAASRTRMARPRR
ncbi:class I SAM-dependent methyltransferase [Sedimentimonas flavescens]|uniref:Class I SAM-dependent methyltransferase n=1 Tax=Sedimentimonas flavescens TaxID=2851012 RepID=A0ABT3A1R7_9RHOB|nr:class I SAM-dependent methyltransferase [Sedimentimonas flavescens]MCV2879669.1 class I SAM-dependent methyltransferase [Sedimentimonas flavescens]